MRRFSFKERLSLSQKMYGKVFRCGNHRIERRCVSIKIFVIIPPLQEWLDPLFYINDINHHAGHRIDRPMKNKTCRIIVAVTVPASGLLSESHEVPFLRPIRSVTTMRSTEFKSLADRQIHGNFFL